MENESQATSPHLHNSGTVPRCATSYPGATTPLPKPRARFPALLRNVTLHSRSKQGHPLPTTRQGGERIQAGPAGSQLSEVLFPALPVLVSLAPSTVLFFHRLLSHRPTIFQSVAGTKMLLDKGSPA